MGARAIRAGGIAAGLAAAALGGAADPPAKPVPIRGLKWGKAEAVAVAAIRPRITSVSAGDTLTILMKDAGRVNVRLGRDTRATSLSRIAAIRVPLEVPRGRTLTGFKTDLRAFCWKDADARVVLMGDLGGVTMLREWPYGTTVEALPYVPLAPTKRAIGATPAAYVANFAVFMQRRKLSSEAMITIDSLDITALFE